ncbi:MAG: flagellar biosynthetic protein FliO [Chitinispirillaceae bacterium]|nr:flagellar biosynthetic protein FliO [Chitinispirillaceae bacterium]
MLRTVLVTGYVVILVCANALSAQDHGQLETDVGNFSISKVRDLAIDAKAIDVVRDTAAGQKSAANQATNYTLIIFRIFGSLIVIIALIYLVSWLIRKSGVGGGTSRIGGGGSMDVLEVLPLGQNRHAVLLRVMDTVYLCGHTQSNISLIDKIEGQRAVEIMTAGKGASTVVQFKEAFSQFMTKIKK